MSPSIITSFHRGLAVDNRGRRRDEILAWDDQRLETSHDFVQWILPTRKRSAFNPDAPVLTDADVVEFQGDQELQDSILACARRMWRFFEARRPWTRMGDHNHLRITRMLDCLMTVGLTAEAYARYAALLSYAKLGKLSKRTLDEWERAVTQE